MSSITGMPLPKTALDIRVTGLQPGGRFWLGVRDKGHEMTWSRTLCDHSIPDNWDITEQLCLNIPLPKGYFGGAFEILFRMRKVGWCALQIPLECTMDTQEFTVSMVKDPIFTTFTGKVLYGAQGVHLPDVTS